MAKRKEMRRSGGCSLGWRRLASGVKKESWRKYRRHAARRKYINKRSGNGAASANREKSVKIA